MSRSCLFILTLALAAAPFVSAETDSALPPVDAWDVRLAAGVHDGPPMLFVEVAPEFIWPEGLEYRVTLNTHSGDVVDGVAWLGAENRGAFVPFPLPGWEYLAGWDLEATAERDLEHQEKRDQLMELLDESEPGEQRASLLDELVSLLPSWEGGEAGEPPVEVWRTSVHLQPVVDGSVLRQKTPKKAPAASTYDWKSRINKPGDPCHGKTPRECVWAQMKRIRDRLCSARLPDGSLRFPFECLVFSSKLDAEPPAVKVACDLEGAGAHTAPNREITVSGDHFLRNDCPGATILHELVHVFDLAQRRLDKWKQWRAVIEQIRQAVGKIRRAVFGAGEPGGFSAGLAELRKLRAEERRLRKTALIELITTECKALFSALEHADFVEPDPKKRLAWVVVAIKAMHAQLSSIFFESGLSRDKEVNRVLCECIKRMQSWIAARAEVNARMDRDKAIGGATWNEYLAITRVALGGCP